MHEISHKIKTILTNDIMTPRNIQNLDLPITFVII